MECVRERRNASLEASAYYTMGARPKPSTCAAHVLALDMPKMIQVRSVPDKLHRELMRRARMSGQTLTAYVQDILEREVARPLASDVFERIRRSAPVDLGRPAAELIREERATRGGS